jgi:hypothetical protein
MLIQVLDVYRLRSERVNEIPKGGVVWCRKRSSEMSAGIDDRKQRVKRPWETVNWETCLHRATVSRKEGYSRNNESGGKK